MKKAISIIGNTFLWLLVIFSLIITMLVFSSTNKNGVANFLGYIPLTVESQSMSPTFNEGDLIICKQIDDPNSLKVDDVITFWTLIDGQKVKNTHRIIKIEKNQNSVSFITRGDNNPVDDALPAYQSELIGKWTDVKLSGAGKILAFLRTKLGFFICIIIPMALFFLFELYKFILTIIRVRNSERVPELDQEEIKRRAIEEYLAEQKSKEEAKEEAKEEGSVSENNQQNNDNVTEESTPDENTAGDSETNDKATADTETDDTKTKDGTVNK